MRSSQGRLRLRFSHCTFLRPNAVAFLGGLVRLAESMGCEIVVDWRSMREDVRTNLGKNRFLEVLGGRSLPWQGNSIPYREDRAARKGELLRYLTHDWLGHSWVNISEALRAEIVSVVWEIYENAFEHSDSPIGLFSCGQHFPRLEKLNLTVVDFGVGIPARVNDFLEGQLSPGDALGWAFLPGHSTKAGSRGVGLGLLRDFIRVNQGHLEIYSGSGYARVDARADIFSTRDAYFGGTVANISFRCDERYYCLASEMTETPLF